MLQSTDVLDKDIYVIAHELCNEFDEFVAVKARKNVSEDVELVLLNNFFDDFDILREDFAEAVATALNHGDDLLDVDVIARESLKDIQPVVVVVPVAELVPETVVVEIERRDIRLGKAERYKELGDGAAREIVDLQDCCDSLDLFNRRRETEPPSVQLAVTILSVRINIYSWTQ